MVCFVLFDTKLARFFCIRRGSKSRSGCGYRRRYQDQRHHNQQQNTSPYSTSFLFRVAFCVRNYGLGTQGRDQPRGWLSRIERRSLLSTYRLNLRAQKSAARKGPAATGGGGCRVPLYSLGCREGGLLGYWVSGVRNSQKPGFRYWPFSETALPVYGILRNLGRARAQKEAGGQPRLKLASILRGQTWVIYWRLGLSQACLAFSSLLFPSSLLIPSA